MVALDTRQDAPRFRAKTLDGEVLTNESVRGKVVLFQFWTTWCPYCKRDMPGIENIARDFSGLIVVGVDVGESKKTVKRFLEASPRPGKVVLTEDTNLAAVFEANRFPLYAVIDQDGKLVGTQKGSGGEGAIRRLLRKAKLESGGDADAPVELQSSPRRD